MGDTKASAGQDERVELAALLADQFAALDDGCPEDPRVLGDGDTLVFDFAWPTNPADELLARAGHEDNLSDFRSVLLAAMVPSLAELVELDQRRVVTSSQPSLEEGIRRGSVTFRLGAPIRQGPEDVEALRGWTLQLRRQARVRRLRYAARRKELQRVREELARMRGQSGSTT